MPSVLLVEDDARLRAIYERALAQAGFDVRVAANGREGLALMWQRSPDVVITDLAMPELDGAGMLQAMRADVALQSIPVLVMTGNGRTTIPAGYPLLRKPFPLQELIDAVRRLAP